MDHFILLSAFMYLLQILIIYRVEPRNLNNRVQGLSERLEQFGECNIDITAEFRNTDFEPIPVPTILVIDTKFKKNVTLLFVMRKDSNLARNRFAFKLREGKCGLDLILCLDGNSDHLFNKYNYLKYRKGDFMNDKYLVIIRHQLELQSGNLYTVLGMIQELKDCRVFLWTVVKFANTINREVKDFLIQGIIYFSLLYYSLSDTGYPIYTFEMRHENSKIMFQMEVFSNKIRKQLFWGPQAKPNYLKLSRNIKLPIDEHQLIRDSTISSNFQTFIINLLKRTNFSGLFDIH